MKLTNAVPHFLNFLKAENLGWLNYLGNHILLFSESDLEEQSKLEILALVESGSSFKIGMEQLSTVDGDKKKTHAEGERLDLLNEFNNYKKISESMEIKFHPQLTIVFGPNGTGKSSLSSAIKILASPLKPVNPLENIFNKDKKSTIPSFAFKFRTTESKRWSQGDGFGLFHNNIKFFDSMIAINYLEERPDTNKVVEIAPFRLEIFDYLEKGINEFRRMLIVKSSKLEEDILLHANALASEFQKDLNTFVNPFENVKATNLLEIKNILLNSAELTEEQQELKVQLLKKIEDLEKVTSIDGLKLLNTELSEIKKFGTSFSKTVVDLKGLNLETYLSDTEKLTALRLRQNILLNEALPVPGKVAEFKEFIKRSKEVVNYENESLETCILCGNDISDDSLKVIHKYYAFLDSLIEKEILELEENFSKRKERFVALRVSHAGLSLIPPRLIKSVTGLKERLDLVGEFLEKGRDFLQENISFQADVVDLLVLDDNSIKGIVLDLDTSINTANANQLKNTEQLEKLRGQVRKLLMQNFLFRHSSKVDALLNSIKAYELFEKVSNIDFTGILRRRSAAAKSASDELLVSEFTNAFSRHYEELTERNFENSGVQILPVKDGGVDVKVGKSKVHHVFSEGEQKIYALSLFFAELEFQDSDVVVFDDPVSSLDYHYVDSFCRKLKNYISRNKNKQIIVFTHDWYFLKDMQDCSDGAKFKEETDFQILKLNDCSNVETNIENIDSLEKSIEENLKKDLMPLSDLIKLSQEMRTLIECIVNKHLFNNQRTQYKRDKLNPSVFYEYSSLVSLTRKEVLELDDLYSVLSKYNHDNPIKIFKAADLEQFKTRFKKIKELKAEFIKRKKEIAAKNELIVS